MEDFIFLQCSKRCFTPFYIVTISIFALRQVDTHVMKNAVYQFVRNAPFLCPLKTLKRFSDVSEGREEVHWEQMGATAE